MGKRQFATCAALLLAIGCLLAAIRSANATTSEPPPGFKVVLCCLDNPRGLTLTHDGAIYVTEAGHGGAGPCAMMRGVQMCYGATGEILRIKHHIVTRVAAGLPSYAPTGGAGSEGPTGICADGSRGLFVTYGLGMDPRQRASLGAGGMHSGYLMRITLSGAAHLVADISGYEADHNPAGGPVDSNPFDVSCQRTYQVVSDAGGNSLFKVTNGKLSLLGVFPSRPTRSTDSVPTGIAVRHHAYYVGELTGKPFDVGVANIYRIAPGQTPTKYLSGFTAIIDLAFAHDGSLYVLEHATGVGLSGPGALIKVSPSGTRTTISSALNHPTALAIARNGAIYVVNDGTDPGAGEILRLSTKD